MNDETKDLPRGPRPASDLEVEGLFRLVGQGADPDAPISDEEADLIDYIADQLPISEEEIDARTKWLLDRLQPQKEDAVAVPRSSPKAASADESAKPTIYRTCQDLKVEAHDLAERVRLNEEILLQLDQGRARSVPHLLLEGLAAVLHTTADHIRRCFAPPEGGPLKMAAHGRRGAGRGRAAVVEFMVIVQTSSLSDEDKRYWWEVVNSEGASR